MGIFYPQLCDQSEDDDIYARAFWAGYPELGPVMALSALALDKRALGAEHFTLLEILVTSAKFRGRGVGAGMVKDIMSKCLVCQR